MKKVSYKLNFAIAGATSSARPRRKLIERIVKAISPPSQSIREDVLIKVKFNCYGKCNRDVDNMLKGLFDGLKIANVLQDDSQIKKVEAEIVEDKGEATTEIDILPFIKIEKGESDQEKVDRIFVSEMKRQHQDHAIPHMVPMEECWVRWYPEMVDSHFVKKGWFVKEEHIMSKYRLTVNFGEIIRSEFYEDYFDIPCDKCVPRT